MSAFFVGLLTTGISCDMIRLYKANTDVNIKDFLINTKIESTSGTKTDEIDLSSFHLEFVNETDINAVYIYDNLISILVG